MLASSLQTLNANVLEPARMQADSIPNSQRRLSELVDANVKSQLLGGDVDQCFKAHVTLCSLLSAGVWLTALPEDEGLELSLIHI